MPDSNENRKKLEAGLKEMRANSELYEMLLKHSAHQLRTAYECLLAEGFQPTEALDIIKARGTSLS